MVKGAILAWNQGTGRFLPDPLELPDPPNRKRDEVVIEVRAAGAANWDAIVRTGGWDVGIKPPMALGVSASAVVRAVG